MSDKDKPLVERLRNERDPYQLDEWGDPMRFAICTEAADKIVTLETSLQSTAEAAATHLKTAVEHQDRIIALKAEIEKLREALREVFEEWAGSEGFIPKTAPEGYLLHLTKRMADIARAAIARAEGRS